MKIELEVSLSIGLQGCEHKDIIEVEIDDLDLEHQDIDNICEQAWKDWSSNYIDGGWKIKEK